MIMSKENKTAYKEVKKQARQKRKEEKKEARQDRKRNKQQPGETSFFLLKRLAGYSIDLE